MWKLNAFNVKIKIKKFNYDENEIKSAIAFSEGVPGRIDRYFNDDKLRELRNNIVILIKNLNKKMNHMSSRINSINNEIKEKNSIFDFIIRIIKKSFSKL